MLLIYRMTVLISCREGDSLGYYTIITDGLQLFYHRFESPYEQCPLKVMKVRKMKIHLLQEANWLMMESSLLIPLVKHTNQLG